MLKNHKKATNNFLYNCNSHTILMQFNQHTFNQFILDNNIITFSEQPFTLKSGKTSQVYINWRTITNDAFLLNQLADFIIQFVRTKNMSADCIYGVPEGATKTAVIASLKLAQSSPNYKAGSHIIAMGRAKPKEHGDPKDRFFIGAPRGDVVVIEDVTTTGGSLIETLDMLKKNNIEVKAAMTLTDRMESLSAKMKERNIEFHAMSTARELVPQAIKRQKLPQHIIEAIQKEFNL